MRFLRGLFVVLLVPGVAYAGKHLQTSDLDKCDGQLVRWSKATQSFQCYTIPQTCAPSMGLAPSGSTAAVCKTFVTNPVTPDEAQLLAFSGCQGAGCSSPGGRGGTVYSVNTLADTTGSCVVANGVTTGTCSLRDCVNGIGPRICVFRIGGVIQLTSTLFVNDPNITIAGQTAPGSGIAVRIKSGASTEADAHTFNVRTNDVVIRFVRMWGRPCSVSAACSYGVAVKGAGSNLVIDHTTMLWFSGETVSGGWDASAASPIRNITIQWSILAEPLKNPQATNVRFSGQGYESGAVIGLDIHHNLMSSSSSRVPEISSASARFISNAVYNWSVFAFNAEHGGSVDLIGNYFKPGPTLANGNMNCKTEFGFGPGQPVDFTKAPSVYMSNNKSDYSMSCASSNLNGLPTRNGVVTGNELDGGWALMTYRTSTYQGVIDQFPLSDTWATRRSSPLNSSFPITTTAASSVTSSLTAIGGVGVSRKLNCDGTWNNYRDAVDSRVLNDFLNGTGKDANVGQTTPAGWNGSEPTLPTDTGACTDTDHDGMPDVWETAQGLDPNDPSDGPEVVPGYVYTNLERYLNGN